MFVSLPLRGHTNQMIAITQELVERGYPVKFVISEVAKNWIATTGAEFIPWEIRLTETENNNDNQPENFWGNVSQEKNNLRGENMMWQHFIKLYSPMYKSLIPIFEKYNLP